MDLKRSYWLAVAINVSLLLLYYVFESPNQDIDFKRFITQYTRYVNSVSSQVKVNATPPLDIAEERRKHALAVKNRTVKRPAQPQESVPTHLPEKDLPPINDQDYILGMMHGLDIYKHFEFHKLGLPSRRLYTPIMGLINDGFQCVFNNIYLLQNPEVIGTQRNFLTDYPPKSVFRKNLPLIGNPTIANSNLTSDHQVPHPHHRKQPLSYNLTFFFTRYPKFHEHFDGGYEAICLFQAYNHIIGREELLRRDRLAHNLEDLIQKLQGAPCANDVRHLTTFVLSDQEGCKRFFTYLDDPEFLESKQLNYSQYVVKIDYLDPLALDAIQEMRLRRKYANGKLCGEIIDDIIVQFRLPNQLVLQKHHLSVFAYVLVASTDPLIVYYQDSYVEMKDANRSTFITLETFQQDLPKHISIRSRMTTAIALLIAKIPFHADSRLFELFKVEFLIDRDYNVYLNAFTDFQEDPIDTDQQHNLSLLFKETVLLMHHIQKQRFTRLRTQILQVQLNQTHQAKIDLISSNINEPYISETSFKLLLHLGGNQTLNTVCRDFQNQV